MSSSLKYQSAERIGESWPAMSALDEVFEEGKEEENKLIKNVFISISVIIKIDIIAFQTSP